MALFGPNSTTNQLAINDDGGEGFNSRIQSIKSAARGFRNFANYRLRILFFCGTLKLLPAACH